ncbi:unnamed protein product [Rotaria magnacalcarata]|uniref:Uncharacterized protein n=1 Tax=Rotaria magnacalcarata TaxID=392030 RepID=A0A8S3H2C5_9BILA|nr:unnamed protein product [Rotaria magnacalcarata]
MSILETIGYDENTIGSPIYIESTTTTNKIFEGKQESAEDSIPIILEIDRCTSMNDENDEEDEEEEEKETSEQDKMVKPSVISLSSITTQQSDLKKECFEKSLIEELRSINNKLDSIKKRFNRVENLSTVIYEMASERRVIHSLCSLGMTSIDGLSSEFYYVHEYQTALISLARELNNNYRHRWACYNHYVDISLSPQTIEINLMGSFGCLPNVSGSLSSPPRFTSFVSPQPSSSNLNSYSWNTIKQKSISYSLVTIVEATTSPVNFYPRYIPTIINNERESYFLF